jgi:hypothetical protein
MDTSALKDRLAVESTVELMAQLNPITSRLWMLRHTAPSVLADKFEAGIVLASRRETEDDHHLPSSDVPCSVREGELPRLGVALLLH